MYLEDIETAMNRIAEYIEGYTFVDFKRDYKTVDAVIRNFEIIGEAAGRIPLEIQGKYPELGWLEMRGMRNIMAHEYFGVSLSIVWHAIEHDLSPLAEGLRQLLDNL